jgi:hypothetical protein
MRVKRILSQVLAGIVLLLFTTVIAACGSSSAAAGTTPAVTATATSCISQATGTIKGINGATLLVTTLQGKDVQAVLTSKTTFVRQAKLTPADLKTVMIVSFIVTHNPDTTYYALAVNVAPL